MRDRREMVDGRFAHALRGTVRCDPMGIRRFEFFQLFQQSVVIEIADFGPGFDIILVVVRADPPTQPVDLLGFKLFPFGWLWFGRLWRNIVGHYIDPFSSPHSGTTVTLFDAAELGIKHKNLKALAPVLRN